MNEKKDDQISILRLILLCVQYHILSASEGEEAIRTGILPENIFERLKIAELRSKN